MRYLTSLTLAVAILVSNRPASGQAPAPLAEQVREAEMAFAATMARRDHAAFAGFVAEEAIFFGRSGPLRGKAAVLQGWRPLFEGPTAPFSWKPEIVEVLASGTLALSSGSVWDPEGKQIGTFNSIWRRDSDGRWRVLFDKGCNP